ncbi:protein TolR [Candidatus Halobeggiatoa sp. HSG11]|nr:protein TolR [Candidatus Halobeggiatoa sp. HSG11]
MNYRKHRRHMAEMNVVPYIDVMLVLLIIFMITSPLLTRSVEVELPAVKQAEVVKTEDINFVIITVNSKGQLFLDDDKQVLTTKELLVKVVALTRFDTSSQVLIKGDHRLSYGEVVKLMSILREAGVEKVGLLTKIQKNVQR